LSLEIPEIEKEIRKRTEILNGLKYMKVIGSHPLNGHLCIRVVAKSKEGGNIYDKNVWNPQISVDNKVIAISPFKVSQFSKFKDGKLFKTKSTLKIRVCSKNVVSKPLKVVKFTLKVKQADQLLEHSWKAPWPKTDLPKPKKREVR